MVSSQAKKIGLWPVEKSLVTVIKFVVCNHLHQIFVEAYLAVSRQIFVFTTTKLIKLWASPSFYSIHVVQSKLPIIKVLKVLCSHGYWWPGFKEILFCVSVSCCWVVQSLCCYTGLFKILGNNLFRGRSRLWQTWIKPRSDFSLFEKFCANGVSKHWFSDIFWRG